MAPLMAGCTLLAAAISDGRMYWVSVGDSHLYILHGGCLRQLNTDHNLRTRLMRAKGNEAGAWEDKDINLSALTSYVGAARLEEIDISAEPLTLTGPDVVLLCSDGLYNALTEGEIEEILSSAAADKAAALLDEALSKGITNQDNISAITVLREIDNHITDILPVDEKTIIIKGRKDNRLRIFSSLLRLLHLSKQDGGDCNGF